MAPGLFGRSSGGPLCWVCSLESKERGEGQKTEDCRKGEEEKEVGIPSMTLR